MSFVYNSCYTRDVLHLTCGTENGERQWSGVISQKGSMAWPWTRPTSVRGKDALKHIATFQLFNCSGDTHNKAMQRRPLQSSHLQFLWPYQAYNLSLAQNIWAYWPVANKLDAPKTVSTFTSITKKAKQRWPVSGLMQEKFKKFTLYWTSEGLNRKEIHWKLVFISLTGHRTICCCPFP